MNIHDEASLAVGVRNATTSRLARRDPRLVELAKGVRVDRYPHVAEMFSMSAIMVWEKEIFELARNGSGAFLNQRVTREMYEYSPSPEFWWFRDFTLAGRVPIYALCVYPSGGALNCILLGASDAEYPTMIGSALNIDRPIEGLWSWIIAAREFTRMKIAAKEPVRLPRGERRRLARQHEVAADVRIVQLRGRESSVWHSVESRQYHHSWIVRGHWRKLHEPRKKDGAVASWIESYIKGTGPLIQPRESIFSVSR